MNVTVEGGRIEVFTDITVVGGGVEVSTVIIVEEGGIQVVTVLVGRVSEVMRGGNIYIRAHY